MKTAEDIVSEKGGRIITVPHDTTIRRALEVMNDKRVGVIVVTRDDRPIGVWSSRDLMRNVLMEGFDPGTAVIENFMVTRILSAPYTDTSFNLMDKFLGLRVNHLLVEKDGRYIGLLSTGDVMKANIQEKNEELRRLNKMVSWDYYEEWKWEPSKRNRT